jgi:hypothetical protein
MQWNTIQPWKWIVFYVQQCLLRWYQHCPPPHYSTYQPHVYWAFETILMQPRNWIFHFWMFNKQNSYMWFTGYLIRHCRSIRLRDNTCYQQNITEARHKRVHLEHASFLWSSKTGKTGVCLEFRILVFFFRKRNWERAQGGFWGASNALFVGAEWRWPRCNQVVKISQATHLWCMFFFMCILYINRRLETGRWCLHL